MFRYLFLPLAMCSQLAIAASPFTTDLSAGLKLDDNITNGKSSKDIQDDSIISLGASTSYNLPVNDISKLSINGSLTFEQYQDFDRLNNTDLSVQLSYHIQPDRTYTATWYVVSAKLGSRAYDSDFRDASYNELALGLGKRLTDTLSLFAGLVHFSSDADNDIFDVDYDRLYANLDIKLGQNNILYSTLSFYSGDVISTNTPPHPSELNAIPWIDDDAYPTLINDWTYRLDADTLALQIGDNYAIDSHQAIDVSMSFYDSDADNNFTYNRNIIQLNYLYRF